MSSVTLVEERIKGVVALGKGCAVGVAILIKERVEGCVSGGMVEKPVVGVVDETVQRVVEKPAEGVVEETLEVVMKYSTESVIEKLKGRMVEEPVNVVV